MGRAEPFDGVFSRLIGEARPAWHCLRSRSRHGVILGRELRSKGFQVFMPATARPVTYGDTVVHVDVPVFPDLVFVFGTAREVAAAAANSSRVVSVVELRADDARPELTVSRARRLLGLPAEAPKAHDDSMPSSGFLMGAG